MLLFNNVLPDGPDYVLLSTANSVTEDSSQTVQCIVPSIYPGKEQTEFRVRVGSQYHTGGAETQVFDSNGVTSTVIYTQTLNFNRNQQGLTLQCEVTWNEAPIEVIKTSNSQVLDVFCRFNYLQI